MTTKKVSLRLDGVNRWSMEKQMPKHASDMQEHTGNPARPTLKCLSPTVGMETFFMLRRNQSRTETHRNSSSQMNNLELADSQMKPAVSTFMECWGLNKQ